MIVIYFDILLNFIWAMCLPRYSSSVNFKLICMGKTKDNSFDVSKRCGEPELLLFIWPIKFYRGAIIFVYLLFVNF